MDRKSALIKLEELFMEERKRTGEEFEALAAASGEALRDLLFEGIRSLDHEYPVQVLQFQVMRSDLYQDRCRIMVCGYDKGWYQDPGPVEGFAEADFLYQPFLELIRRLNDQIGVFMGAVSVYDVRNLVCEYFMECYKGLAGRARSWFFLFDEWAKEEGFHFPVPFRVVWGPYRGETEMIFHMDRTGKSHAEFLEELEEDKKRNREMHFYFSFVQSSQNGLQCGKEGFAFLTMKQSSFVHTQFKECKFASPDFQDSVMDWCSFEGSSLFGSNFSRGRGYQVNFGGTDIRNSTFEKIHLRKGDFTGAKLNGVAFTDGILEECSFRDASLTDVDLRAVSLEGIDFTGAVLERVYIWEKDAADLKVTEKQAEQVLVVAERAE